MSLKTLAFLKSYAPELRRTLLYTLLIAVLHTMSWQNETVKGYWTQQILCKTP